MIYKINIPYRRIDIYIHKFDVHVLNNTICYCNDNHGINQYICLIHLSEKRENGVCDFVTSEVMQ